MWCPDIFWDYVQCYSIFDAQVSICVFSAAWVEAVMTASDNASQEPHTESEIQAWIFSAPVHGLGKCRMHIWSGQCWWHWARERFRTRTRLRWIPTCTSPPSMVLPIYSLPVNEAAVIQSQSWWCLLPHLSFFSFFPSPSPTTVLNTPGSTTPMPIPAYMTIQSSCSRTSITTTISPTTPTATVWPALEGTHQSEGPSGPLSTMWTSLHR